MKGFFASLLKDSNNNTISSKRIVVFMCIIMMVAGFIANVRYGVEVSEHIYTSIMYVVLVGVGFTGIEKFGHMAINAERADKSTECCNCCYCNAKNESTAFGEATDGPS